jgi:hypothetical protein
VTSLPKSSSFDGGQDGDLVDEVGLRALKRRYGQCRVGETQAFEVLTLSPLVSSGFPLLILFPLCPGGAT